MTAAACAYNLATATADHLAHPDAISHLTNKATTAAATRNAWRPQSLADGLPGIALLHIELAAADLRPWHRVHDWLTALTRTPVITGADSHLFHGAPALAHVLTCAAAVRPGSYARVLDQLDIAITTDTRRRVNAAHVRIDHGELPALAEFDLIRGLTGIGAYLLRRDPGGNTIRSVLAYLVRLTEPVTYQGETLPGWWTLSGPSGRDDARFPGGHANNGIAHGIAGPLALLALAALRGVTVEGHTHAITTICHWLDAWRTVTHTGPVWPYWVTRPDLDAGHRAAPGPQRPSWCYGTAGLARAQQLAALATADAVRRDMAEAAFVLALSDPAQRATITDRSLCHGHTGLAHVAARVAAEATPAAAQQLQAMLPALLDTQSGESHPTAAALLDPSQGGPGLLDGGAGVALATLAAYAGSRSGWDACLLIASPTTTDGRSPSHAHNPMASIQRGVH